MVVAKSIAETRIVSTSKKSVAKDLAFTASNALTVDHLFANVTNASTWARDVSRKSNIGLFECIKCCPLNA